MTLLVMLAVHSFCTPSRLCRLERLRTLVCCQVFSADFIVVPIYPAFPSAETVQELQRAFLRELRAQRAAAALVHPARDGVHLLLLPAAAAVRLHAHMKALARFAHGNNAPLICRTGTGQNALSALVYDGSQQVLPLSRLV